ncbi:MAG: hypothetical protein HW384_137 [Dehalococcoidia bacterium]|nr:hypothetical protein [Dehalococcoidia bacterium]
MVPKTNQEEGMILLLALIAMVGGILIIGPLMTYISTNLYSLQKGTAAIKENYAADSGVEHAIWRIKYDGLLLDFETPFNYVYPSVNDLPIGVTITKLFYGASALCGDNLSPNPNNRAEVTRTVDPTTAPPGVPTVFNYSIIFKNIGTSSLHFEEIGYELPSGFTYVVGSAGGFTTDAPTINNTIFTWDFSPPLPKIDNGEQFTQTFQATGILDNGNYCGFCDGAWVIFTPDDVGCVMANGGERYNIRAEAGSIYIQSAIGISEGDVVVLSWDIK